MKNHSIKNGEFTRYSNKIGLYANRPPADQTGFVDSNPNIVINLSFPFKDCVLEGGMTKEDSREGRQERYLHMDFNKKDVDTLFERKVLTNYEQSDRKPLSQIEFFDEEGNLKQNLLVKGNNLIALHSLKVRLSGRVKLIYIDPPYNTGSDSFKYNDRFNHSSYLVFMKNRLEVARLFLKEDGVMWVHCDDNEQAYLKVLMDEIFGRQNFIETITVVNNPRGRDYGGIANMHEFIHVYAKDRSHCSLYQIEDRNKDFPYEDATSGFSIRELRNRNTQFNDKNRPNLCYPFYVSPHEELDNGFLKISLVPSPSSVEVYPKKSQDIQTVWRWGKEKSASNLNKNIVGKKMKDGHFMIVEKYRKNTYMPRSVWWDKDVNSEKGTLHLKEIFGKKVFNYPKPEQLLQRIIEISSRPNDIVLDYHLGSGTTAATAHKMGRRWVGIEQMSYVETVTRERLRKVIEGEQGGISKDVIWQGGGSFVYFELKKYNQEFVERIVQADSLAELKPIYEDMMKNSFLQFWFDKKTNNEENGYNEMDLNQRKNFLISILDENQLYLNYADMDDVRYHVSEQDKELSNKFYTEHVGEASNG